MTTHATTYSLAELLICAASECWRNDGEVLASGIDVIPRLAASLSMLSANPELLMTDPEAFMVAEPVPLGARNGYKPKYDSWMGFSRIFDNVWGGKRHALVGPTQIDRFGQANISCIGAYAKPKAQMLGVRGFPGNSISHANSFLVPSHNRRVFVEGEVDRVASVGHDIGTPGRDVNQSFERASLWYDHVNKPGGEFLYAREQEVYLGMCRRWREMPKPTIAMVQGACIAGGLMLAWVCDLIVAAEDSYYADPVVRMGIPAWSTSPTCMS